MLSSKRARFRALPTLVVICSLLLPNDAFSFQPTHPADCSFSLKIHNSVSGRLVRKERQYSSKTRVRMVTRRRGPVPGARKYIWGYRLAKFASTLAWGTMAYVALSIHPDPRFRDCTLRHNLLTMSQAFAFPLPVLWASFDALSISARYGKLDSPTARTLGLAVGVALFWLATSMAMAPSFAFGYDLYGFRQKVSSGLAHGLAGLFTMGVLLRKSTPGQVVRDTFDSLWNLGPKLTDSGSFVRNSSLLATGSLGLLCFTVLPILSPYPLATVPTILGKRLSRPASAFTLLGSSMAYCLKELNYLKEKSMESAPGTVGTLESTMGSTMGSTLGSVLGSTSGSTLASLGSAQREVGNDDLSRVLRRGLAVGSGLHVFLIALKLVGVDGGGWILPGRGLWEAYPAMMSVPLATGLSLATHSILCLATCS